ncbi:RICIN domain-containing protein [Streptomyces sp. CA-135486]|uniref:RICIN domain-containing protein n=1 Tax=Streptomyces sp. CA-135486 TaxID=3240049 RepID=UPI003D8DBEA7
MPEQQNAGESASTPKTAPPSGEAPSGQPPATEPPGTGSAATEPAASAQRPGTEPAASASTTAGEATSPPSSVPDTGGTGSLPAVSGETSARSGATTSQAPQTSQAPEPGATTQEGEPRAAGASPAAAGLAAVGGVRPEEPDPAGASNGPNKPVLAGAAIVGAVLVAIPLLLTGSASDDEEKSAAVVDAANTVLDEEGPDRSGAFVPQPSSPPRKRAPAAPPLSKGPAREAPPATRRQDSGTTARDRSQAPRRRASARRSGATGPDLSRVLIKNWKNQTCVDIPAFGKGVQDGPVNQSTCNSTAEDNQLWNLEAASSGSGPGGAKLYVIRNVKDGQCLDLPYYGGTGATTRITEYPCNRTTGDNQLWWLQKRANNTYWIRNHASSDLCLDVAGSNDRRRDVRLTLFYCSDTDDQNWLFTSR